MMIWKEGVSLFYNSELLEIELEGGLDEIGRVFWCLIIKQYWLAAKIYLALPMMMVVIFTTSEMSFIYTSRFRKLW